MTAGTTTALTDDRRQRTARPPHRWTRRIGVLCLFAVIGFAALGVFGFFSFVHTVLNPDRDVRAADGIVALTGGADRLTDALELLERGWAGRLLITGVNPGTSGNELEKQVPRFAEFAACCVDVDRRAATTVGNAVETRRWAKSRGIRSLIVVTSSYHMPRAMTELGRALPDITLIPYPVVTDKLKENAWWRNPTTARLLVSEYVKFLLANAKMRLSPNSEDFTTAGYAARL